MAETSCRLPTERKNKPLDIAAEMANLYGVINAVNKQDWDQALDRLQGLQARYGRQSSAQSH